jgi:hypothetical protein
MVLPSDFFAVFKHFQKIFEENLWKKNLEEKFGKNFQKKNFW